MEEAGLEPHLARALEVKKRMPGRNKTDTRDATGLAILVRNHALPEVWIPPAKLLDIRDLMRTRLSIRQQGTPCSRKRHFVNALIRPFIHPVLCAVYVSAERASGGGQRSARRTVDLRIAPLSVRVHCLVKVAVGAEKEIPIAPPSSNALIALPNAAFAGTLLEAVTSSPPPASRINGLIDVLVGSLVHPVLGPI
jgi:hypothetical protein